jgi:hypothetical protein
MRAVCKRAGGIPSVGTWTRWCQVRLSGAALGGGGGFPRHAFPTLDMVVWEQGAIDFRPPRSGLGGYMQETSPGWPPTTNISML